MLGHTGAGKSTLISRLLAASVQGNEFLDWHGAGEIRALVVDLEQSQADAKRMLREAGLEQSEAIGYSLVPDGLSLDSDDAQLAAVEQVIRRRRLLGRRLRPLLQGSNDGKTRDIRAELLAVLADGEWRTLTELRRKEGDGGIGADPKTIRPMLDALTVEGLLEHRIGPSGRQPSAKCWRVSSASYDTDDTAPLFCASGETEEVGVVVSSPYRGDTMTTPTPDTATVAAPGVVNPHDTPPTT